MTKNEIKNRFLTLKGMSFYKLQFLFLVFQLSSNLNHFLILVLLHFISFHLLFVCTKEYQEIQCMDDNSLQKLFSSLVPRRITVLLSVYMHACTIFQPKLMIVQLLSQSTTLVQNINWLCLIWLNIDFLKGKLKYMHGKQIMNWKSGINRSTLNLWS